MFDLKKLFAANFKRNIHERLGIFAVRQTFAYSSKKLQKGKTALYVRRPTISQQHLNNI